MRTSVLHLFACALLLQSGCALLSQTEGRKYETVTAELTADTERARELNDKAIRLIEKVHLDRARHAVDEALIADVNFAPAHNTLGQIHFQQGNFYLAAWEFEFAIRLNPNLGEFHNNLGLVYEAAGRFPQAIEQFSMAHQLDPEDYQFVSNLARARIRHGERNSETRQLLEQVVFLDPRPDWKDWARQQLTQSHLNIPATDVYQTVSEPLPAGEVPPVPDSLQIPGAPLPDSDSASWSQ